jgi:predicted peroxiredoxin
MHVISTTGPDNATKSVLPFVAAKGAMSHDEDVDLFLMQEATYLGTERVELDELNAPGLPSVADVLEALQGNEAIRSAIVCEPCAAARGIEESDLAAWAEFGGAGDLVTQAKRNDETLTF